MHRSSMALFALLCVGLLVGANAQNQDQNQNQNNQNQNNQNQNNQNNQNQNDPVRAASRDSSSTLTEALAKARLKLLDIHSCLPCAGLQRRKPSVLRCLQQRHRRFHLQQRRH